MGWRGVGVVAEQVGGEREGGFMAKGVNFIVLLSC
jgi:hypothetical protein